MRSLVHKIKPICVAAALMVAGQAVAQPVSQDGGKPQPPKELALTPKGEPSPALRYRLLPIAPERTPGDAAPIYLRIRHSQNEEKLKAIDANHQNWSDLPIDKFPTADARKFVDSWAGILKQIEFGTARQSCDWNYTLPEQKYDAISILLPDVQEMRTWSRLLVVKARTEIAEKKYDDAIGTLKTGMTFGRHVGQGPFLISALVGAAIQNSMLGVLEELIAQPDAPNLYWALTTLPDPTIPLRDAFEFEQRLCEMMVPELNSDEARRSEAEWSVSVNRLFEQMRRLYQIISQGEEGPDTPKARIAADLASFKAEVLRDARPWLAAHGWDQRGVDGMSDDEAVMRAVLGQYRVLRDEAFKAGYLPFAASRGTAEKTRAEIEKAASGPLSVYAAVFPALRKAFREEARLGRRIAALRIIEAIRLHATAQGSKLPKSLGEIDELPIPIDPVRAKPFDYTVEGDTATLSAPGVDGDVGTSLQYRLTIRK